MRFSTRKFVQCDEEMISKRALTLAVLCSQVQIWKRWKCAHTQAWTCEGAPSGRCCHCWSVSNCVLPYLNLHPMLQLWAMTHSYSKNNDKKHSPCGKKQPPYGKKHSPCGKKHSPCGKNNDKRVNNNKKPYGKTHTPCGRVVLFVFLRTRVR